MSLAHVDLGVFIFHNDVSCLSPDTAFNTGCANFQTRIFPGESEHSHFCHKTIKNRAEGKSEFMNRSVVLCTTLFTTSQQTAAILLKKRTCRINSHNVGKILVFLRNKPHTTRRWKLCMGVYYGIYEGTPFAWTLWASDSLFFFSFPQNVSFAVTKEKEKIKQ